MCSIDDLGTQAAAMDNTRLDSIPGRRPFSGSQPLFAGAMFLGGNHGTSIWTGFFWAMLALLAWPILISMLAILRAYYKPAQRRDYADSHRLPLSRRVKGPARSNGLHRTLRPLRFK